MDTITIIKRMDDCENLFIDVIIDGDLYESYNYEFLSIQHEEDMRNIFNAVVKVLKS